MLLFSSMRKKMFACVQFLNIRVVWSLLLHTVGAILRLTVCNFGNLARG